MKIFLIHINLIILLTILSSCGTVNLAPCVNKKFAELKIRWGEEDKKMGIIKGYEVDAYAKVYSIYKDGNSTGFHMKELIQMDASDYCQLMKKIQNEFIAVQALTAPGEVSRFVEMKNPAMMFEGRAVWNAKFETYLSKGFRAIYDSLQATVSKN